MPDFQTRKAIYETCNTYSKGVNLLALAASALLVAASFIDGKVMKNEVVPQPQQPKQQVPNPAKVAGF
jgi:hypothetical protein